MRIRLILLAFLVALPYIGKAQDDDMYFVPSRKSKSAPVTTQATHPVSTPVEASAATAAEDDDVSCYTGHLRDVDEYNRRSSTSVPDAPDVVIVDTLGMKWVLSKSGDGECVWIPYEDYQKQQLQPDDRLEGDDAYYDDDDYCCSLRLARFHGCISPYCLAWYDPWYYDYLWYDPWYSWYYHLWYWGNGWGLGWYGWHSWGWGGGWHHGGGLAYGGRRGSTFGHTRGGALATAGRGRNTTSSYARGGNRTSPAGRTNVSSSRSNISSSRTSASSASRSSSSVSRSVGSGSRSVSSGFSGGGRAGGFSGGGGRAGGFSGGGSRGGGGRR